LAFNAQPLYRRATRGVAVAQGLGYGEPQAGDEVEDLHALLAAVKAAVPDVQAVASGAILSSYQRTRVENVYVR
jgi:diphthine-ammonia ligase